MDEFSLVTLNSAHAEQVSKLRTEAYRRHYGERADVDRLKWNANDERFLNIGLIRNRDGELMSAVRLAYLKTAFDFYKVLLLEHDPDRFPLPLIALGRGTTAAGFEGKGFHGVLRWAALKIASETNAKAVVGTMEEGSLRIKQMTEIGYEFVNNAGSWGGFLRNEKPIVVGILYADDRLHRACEILNERYQRRNIQFVDEIDSAAAVLKLQSTVSFAEEK